MKSKIEFPHHLIITIDGPAGSGKSTTAKRLARHLDYLYLDTGAMYRAVTLKVLRRGITENRKAEVVQLLHHTEVELRRKDHALIVLLDGEDVSKYLRTPEIDQEIGWVSQLPSVREKMVHLQRWIGANGGLVAEGRDMGTVVFPNADFKFFMVASLEVRAQRRLLQMQEQGISTSLEVIRHELLRRDQVDSERSLSPLLKAADAVEIDTSSMSIDQQTEWILHYVQAELQR